MAVVAETHHHDDHVLALFQIGMPSRKQPGCSKAPAVPHLIRLGKSSGNPIPMFRQQVRMTLGDVPLTLAAEFDLPTEIGTGKRGFDNDLLFRAIQVTEDRLKE